ncbi:helix-turn-helix transcriptional regulator [Fibrella sp. HMF5335]|uniref:Helix-turn-helix transcriptional regulator n=1 Tax=Fibrella rubiginis TaxID=2817060 RepID=A0A939K4N7_9BACT|nr:helix-turn-helix transcriptional regulator [Fibrella rubiginis]MBO0935590.1 helix-turn-helix transcriptional regulator [Fibrella rubiginis]
MQQLPLHLDFFALIMLLGVAQGLFLGVFFLSGARGQQVANRCLGWFLLALTAVSTEILLNYTNYITRLPALVDFSEPLNFVLGPLFFLFTTAKLHNQLPRRWGWHLLPLVFWALYSISWQFQPVEVKYNNFLSANHPDQRPLPEPTHWLPEDILGDLRHYINELTLLSLLAYAVLGIYVLTKTYRRQGYSFWQVPPGQYRQLRNLGLLSLTFPLLIAVVKPQFDEDLGDYILVCYITAMLYLANFLTMRYPAFFTTNLPPAPVMADEPKKKYEKSTLTTDVETAVLTRLDQLLMTEKPHLDSTLSLPKLAAQLRVSPHHLSQLLNDRLGQTFFDWLATHRVAEARRLLTDEATAHLKIDDIAERVGYNATSAFHTAFKRITNQTPAQFRDANRTATGSSRSARSS